MNMLGNKIAVILTVLILISTIGCEEQKIEEGNVVQIEDLGIRKGVFERRFIMTSTYTDNNEFTPKLLISEIDKLLLPNYLLINDAYKLGLNKDQVFVNKALMYKLNLIAANHPIYTENFSLSKEEMIEFYNKKEFAFDFEIVKNISYYRVDSIYKYLKEGNEIEFNDDDKKMQSFPSKFKFTNSTYADHGPVEVYDKLLEMKEGEVSEPIYTASVWVVVKLKQKKKIKQKPYEEFKRDLIDQYQQIMKDKQVELLTKNLREKYNLKIDQENSEKIIKSFFVKNGYASFSRDRFNESDLDDIIISTTEEKINLDFLVYVLNSSMMFNSVENITQKDIDVFVNNFANNTVLYSDALEKGVDNIEIIRDRFENNENRLLYSKYLKEEISDKVVVSEEDAQDYYNYKRDEWKGEFNEVKSSVIRKLRQKLMYQRSDELIEKFKSDFNIQYNMELLKELADKFTEEKKSVN